jgi:uncharacterized protein with HEPN domain
VSHDWRLYLDDIAECSRRVLEYTRGMTLEEFLLDTRTYDAVLRNLEIIGEATQKVPADARLRYPDVAWSEIARFRDRLAHGYRHLDDAIIWGTVQNDIVPLLQRVQQILAAEDREPGS